MKQWLQKAIANPWLKRYILIGYAAKGILYLLIGIFAVQAALISPQKALGTYNSLNIIANQPFGKLLVFLLGIGLMGYSLRRFLQAILTPRKSSSSLKTTLQRIGYLMSCFSYTGVAYTTFNLILELGEYDDKIQDSVRQIFQQPLGEWLVFLAGSIVITIGLSYLYGAYSGSYISEFDSFDIHHRLEKWATRIGKVGVAARGVSFILIGAFSIQAAIDSNSAIAGGLENALRLLEDKPLGFVWLILIGIGFICYGLYMLVAARYRRYAI